MYDNMDYDDWVEAYWACYPDEGVETLCDGFWAEEDGNASECDTFYRWDPVLDKPAGLEEFVDFGFPGAWEDGPGRLALYTRTASSSNTPVEIMGEDIPEDTSPADAHAKVMTFLEKAKQHILANGIATPSR